MHTSKVVVVALITGIAVAAGTFFGLRGLVGQAPAPKMVEVPSLAGMAVEQARELAEAKELRLAIFERRPAGQAAGRVIKQVPLPGSSVPLGTATYVIVSSGTRSAALATPTPKAPAAAPPAVAPKPATAPGQPAPTAAAAAPGEQIVVPRVRGRSLKRATKQLNDAGLRVGRVRSRVDEDRAPGVVLKQRPKAGERIAKGSAVEIWLNDTE